MKIETVAGGFEELHLLRFRHARAPHAWAGGEDLERVAADLGRGDRCVFERFGDGSVGADPQRNFDSNKRRIVTNARLRIAVESVITALLDISRKYCSGRRRSAARNQCYRGFAPP